MTTPTPSSDPPTAAGASPLDLALLTRLAGEFFRQPPGAGPAITGFGTGLVPDAAATVPAPAAGGLTVPSNPLPPGLPTGPLPQPTTTHAAGLAPVVPGLNLVPTGPDQAAARLRPSPAQLPHAAAPNGLPDAAVVAAPGFDGRTGSALLGVPDPFGAVAALQPATVPRGAFGGLPALAPPPAPSFYFVPASSAGHDPGPATPPAQPAFDVHAVRRDFPILQERVNGRPLVWFDNAATTQKPQAVIDRLAHFYRHENSNIHRAAHALAARATDAYEAARTTVARFLGAASPDEIVFVRGCTEGINLIAQTCGKARLQPGDEIVVTHLEHHANIVPWQQIAAERSARLRVIPVDDTGQVILSEAARIIGPRTRVVSVSQVSNALGTVVPVQALVEMGRAVGAATVVDGAQSVSHLAVDVRSIGCDFFVFSGHKVFGPTGIGAVYGRREVLESMPPWQGGGNMIEDVTFEHTRYQGPPARFEAGTGNIADAAGLATALDYVQRIGLDRIAAYEHALLVHGTERLRGIPGLRLIGTATEKASVLSFTLQGHAPEQVGRALDAEGIAVRSGHHCAQPILRRFGVEATVRPSFAFYNTFDEIDHLADVVRRLARA